MLFLFDVICESSVKEGIGGEIWIRRVFLVIITRVMFGRHHCGLNVMFQVED